MAGYETGILHTHGNVLLTRQEAFELLAREYVRIQVLNDDVDRMIGDTIRRGAARRVSTYIARDVAS